MEKNCRFDIDLQNILTDINLIDNKAERVIAYVDVIHFIRECIYNNESNRSNKDNYVSIINNQLINIVNTVLENVEKELIDTLTQMELQ